MSEEQTLLGRVRAHLGDVDYAVELHTGRHRLVADEPASHGGTDAGPGPFSLLLSGLAACTAITLRMYAQRKRWNLKSVEVDARLVREGDAFHIDRIISLQGVLDAEQTARLLEMVRDPP
jgi:putative redox protein